MTQDSSTGRPTSADPAGGMPVTRAPAPPAMPGPPPGMSTPRSETTRPPTTTKVGRSRFGGVWVGLIVAAVILVLLLVFILQNSRSARIDFLWMSGQAPLAVAILLGVAAGALLVAVPGTVRILQLRKSIHHRD
jgi:uncharacterized integral membrane protein